MTSEPTGLRDRAERELCADLLIRVITVRGDGFGYQLQRLDPSGERVMSVRPVEKPVYTLFTEAVRGRVALLERWMKETDK